ncbi:hypothetical protein [Winogradskyella sp.]|uniref:hypothetical protein n=1 Tax=Winogradskyella sp. TaxID=1883156 RepID=UPI003BA99C66
MSDEELQIRFDEAYKSKDWEKSKALIDEVIERHPDSVEIYLTRAILSSNLKRKNQREITSDLTIYLDSFPDNYVVKTLRFQSNYLDSKFDEALEEIDQIIAKKGRNPYLLAWKGNIAFAAKKYDIALDSYNQRLKLSGSYEDLRNTYYYRIFSKYFSGNKEGASWDCAFLPDRGFKEDRELMQRIEEDKLVFEELTNFIVPSSSLNSIEEALNNYCYDIDIFQGERLHRSKLIDQFFYLEKVDDLKELLKNPDEVYALNLSDSNLKELPTELFEFKNLEYLNLSSNRFRDNEKLFDDLSKFPNLIFLELNRCYLRRLPDNISKLKNLMMLSLTFNDFRKINEHIGELSMLKYLDLGANGKLRELPASIGNLRCLQMLDISPNGLNGLRDELANCSELISIVGNAGTIKRLPKDIGRLINLRHLNLGSNRIKELPESFGELVGLEDLSLGSNDLRVLPKSFSQLKNLDFCGLAYNRFNDFPEEVLGLENILTLWLHNNAFKAIPDDIAELPKLKYLLVDHQIITDENIESLKRINPELKISRHDTRRYVRGPKRKN